MPKTKKPNHIIRPFRGRVSFTGDFFILVEESPRA